MVSYEKEGDLEIHLADVGGYRQRHPDKPGSVELPGGDEGTNKRKGPAQREQTPSGVLRDLLEDSRQEQTQP